MKRSAKSQRICWWFLPKVSHYSLTLLLSAVMLADAVGATPRNRGLQIAQQPETTQQNATRAAAKRVYQEGEQLYKQGTAESLRQAIAKYQEALKLWQQLDDKRWEAETLNNIGKVYDDLGEKQEVLKYYNQALPILRAVGDKGIEASTLNNIGIVYDDLGEKQEGLKYYNQALIILRAVGYREEEAKMLFHIALLEHSRGNLQPAQTHIQAAIEIFEDLRAKITNEELRAAYVASVRPYYDFYTYLLMELQKKDP
jgi:tetratricopeptide (TPR) repeat protein